MHEYDLNKLKERLSLYDRSETNEELINGLEELYPGCFKDEDFAKFVGLHKDQIQKIIEIDRIYSCFDKSIQTYLVDYLSFWDISRISPYAIDVLENDIIGGLSDEDYAKLELDEYYDGIGVAEGWWLDYTAATDYERNKDGEEGFLICRKYSEWGEDGNEQSTNPCGIFVPLMDFKNARIWWHNSHAKESEYAQEWLDAMTPLLEKVKSLPYKNIHELLQLTYIEKNLNEIMQIYHKNLMLPVEQRDPNFFDLCDVIDAYIVQYGGKVKGMGFDTEFESTRLFNYENEETPVVVSSISLYDEERDGSGPQDVWHYYDKDGHPDSTYELDSYFPSEENVKQYIDTGSIKIDYPAIQTLVERYRAEYEQDEANVTHETEEVRDITDRSPEVAQAIYDEVAKAQEVQKEGQGQAQGDE